MLFLLLLYPALLGSGASIAPLPCSHKVILGKECSTCGLTRSIQALYFGSPSDSIQFHPGGVVIVGFILFQILARFAGFAFPSLRFAIFDLVQLCSGWILISLFMWSPFK